MRIGLLGQDRYELLDDKGEQVQQGSVLPEWVREASARRRAVVDIIGEKLKIPQPPPRLTAEVESEAVLVPHEHGQYLAAMPEHEHEHGHNFIEHYHEEISDLEAKTAEDNLRTLEKIQDLTSRLLTHWHPESAPLKHDHVVTEDAVLGLQALVNRLLVHDHDAKSHEHADIATPRLDGLDALVAIIRQQVDQHGHVFPVHSHPLEEHAHPERLHVHGDFLTKAAFEEYLNRPRGQWEAEEISAGEVGGRRRFIVEESR